MTIVFQVLLGALAIFFLYATYMNTKTWRWPHVTMTFFVFVVSIVFLVYAAMALKTRRTWIKLHDETAAKVATAETELESKVRGKPTDVEAKEPSVVSVREDLGRTIIDRGRVWRGCIPSPPNFQTGTVVVATAPPPDPNQPAPAAGAA